MNSIASSYFTTRNFRYVDRIVRSHEKRFRMSLHLLIFLKTSHLSPSQTTAFAINYTNMLALILTLFLCSFLCLKVQGFRRSSSNLIRAHAAWKSTWSRNSDAPEEPLDKNIGKDGQRRTGRYIPVSEDDDDGLFSETDDEDDTELENRMALELYDQLRGLEPLLSVDSLLEWDDVKEVVARGYMTVEVVHLILAEVGITNNKLTFPQFMEAVNIINQVSLAVEHGGLEEDDGRSSSETRIPITEAEWYNLYEHEDDEDEPPDFTQHQASDLDKGGHGLFKGKTFEEWLEGDE